MSIFFAYDYNLNKVKEFSRLDGYDPKQYYRVYGLLQKDNPPVLIEYKKFPNKNITEKEIRRFLKRMGLDVVFKTQQYVEWIEIGLRKDVRQDFSLAGAAVHTIIGYMEGKVNLYGQLNKIGFKRMASEKIF